MSEAIYQDMHSCTIVIVDYEHVCKCDATDPALSGIGLCRHAAGAAEAGLLLFLPSVGGTLESRGDVEDAFGGHLLGRHDLVGLSQEEVFGQTHIVVGVGECSSSLVNDRELDIDDGFDTKAVLDLGRDVLLKLLLEDVGLDVQAERSRGEGSKAIELSIAPGGGRQLSFSQVLND